MSETGTFKNDEILDISTFYEMSLFTESNLSLPLPSIMCSNDGISWVEYDKLHNNYMYLSELMANKIKVVCNESMVLHYNANLKK